MSMLSPSEQHKYMDLRDSVVVVDHIGCNHSIFAYRDLDCLPISWILVIYLEIGCTKGQKRKSEICHLKMSVWRLVCSYPIEQEYHFRIQQRGRARVVN